jgi:hypothetical protein
MKEKVKEKRNSKRERSEKRQEMGQQDERSVAPSALLVISSNFVLE